MRVGVQDVSDIRGNPWQGFIWSKKLLGEGDGE